jgi:hypothetical protein
VPADVQRGQRREALREVAVDELVHALGPQQVLQPVLAQVAQGNPDWQGVPGELRGGRREHHLAPVGGGGQPGATVQRRPEVVPVLEFDLARVQPHPDAEVTERAPVLGLHPSLAGERGRDRAGGRGEGGVDGVPHRLEHRPPVRLDGFAQQGVVPAHGLPVGGRAGLEQAGAPLQVGEQEGDGPGRQLRQIPHRRAIRWPPQATLE